MEGLIELSKSPDKATRLAAIKETLDRLLGKPAVFVDATHTRVDVGQLYLAVIMIRGIARLLAKMREH
jgi:hypothetical protein